MSVTESHIDPGNRKQQLVFATTLRKFAQDIEDGKQAILGFSSSADTMDVPVFSKDGHDTGVIGTEFTGDYDLSMRIRAKMPIKNQATPLLLIQEAEELAVRLREMEDSIDRTAADLLDRLVGTLRASLGIPDDKTWFVTAIMEVEAPDIFKAREAAVAKFLEGGFGHALNHELFISAVSDTDPSVETKEPE